MNLLVTTWGELFQDLWNTEIWSWNSFVSVVLIAIWARLIL